MTGITGPTPDNKPDLKAIDVKVKMYCAPTIQDGVEVLLRELWYWEKNQSKYPDEAADVAQSVKYHLTRLMHKSETYSLPPIPDTIYDLFSWVLFVHTHFCGLEIQADWEATVKAACRSVKKRMTVEQVIPIALNIISTTPHLTQAKLRILCGRPGKNTLVKAIDNTPELKKYFGKDKEKTPAPKAVQLTEKIINETPAPKEPEPLPNETKTDRILAEVLEDLRKEKPATYDSAAEQLKNMEPEQRQKFAQFCENEKLRLKKGKIQKQYKAL